MIILLAKYDVDHVTINIHLNEKPKWLNEINPAGKVPVLEVASKYIADSAQINQFLIGHRVPLIPAIRHLVQRM